MELKDFLHYAVMGRHTAITYKIKGWDWYEYQGLAELTQHVEYGCEFDKHGFCQVSGGRSGDRRFMCCCGGCYESVGHLTVLPLEWAQLNIYADLFLEVEKKDNIVTAAGFWRKDGGCALPRKMRSVTCLRYNCRPNTYCPPWQEKLFKMLARREGNMTVNDYKCQYEHQAVERMRKWISSSKEEK